MLVQKPKNVSSPPGKRNVCFNSEDLCSPDYQGYVLREVGFHANLLEPGGGSAELLPLYTLSGKPSPLGIPLESLCARPALRFLSLCILDLGHDK